ncbi:unnamed protein product, partial [Diabrotica balteata]
GNLYHYNNRGFRSQKSEDAESPDKNDHVGTGGVAPACNVRHKIVVMGAAKVGKSSIITQFLYGTFSSKYKRTVEEMHHGEFNVAGVHLTLDILDTSGAYEFPAMRALSISSADAFILVYDVTDSGTFEEARALRDQIHEAKCSTNVPIVVVGNKTDLTGDRENVESGINGLKERKIMITKSKSIQPPYKNEASRSEYQVPNKTNNKKKPLITVSSSESLSDFSLHDDLLDDVSSEDEPMKRSKRSSSSEDDSPLIELK